MLSPLPVFCRNETHSPPVGHLCSRWWCTWSLSPALQSSCTVTSPGHMLALICRLTGLCLAPLESWMGPLVLIQLYKHCYLSAPQWSIHGVTDSWHRQRSQQDLSAPQWSIHGVTDSWHRQRSQQGLSAPQWSIHEIGFLAQTAITTGTYVCTSQCSSLTEDQCCSFWTVCEKLWTKNFHRNSLKKYIFEYFRN
jgi:hypothetical protein